MRFKRSSRLTKLLILVLVAYATVTLVTLQSQITEKQALAEELQTSIDATNQEKSAPGAGHQRSGHRRRRGGRGAAEIGARGQG